MALTKDPAVDAYLAKQPKQNLAALKKVRAAIRRALPKGATELISYSIPAYRLPEGMVVFFAGWAEHYAVYPLGTLVPEKLGKQLAKYALSKGTVRFPLSEPVPEQLIERLVKLRVQETLERAALKRSPKARSKTR